MAIGVALAAMSQCSGLSTVFATGLLNSPRLSSLIDLNAERLSKAYTTLTTFFKNYQIQYIPCNAGIYLFVKIAPKAKTWEDEAAMVERLKNAGVLVSSGRAYHGPETEKGWARISFAVKPSDLEEAIRRMKTVYKATNGSIYMER
jgi:aspartate/methionine/tyrosine aminotransferase